MKRDFLFRVDRLIVDIASAVSPAGKQSIRELARLILLTHRVDQGSWSTDPEAALFAPERSETIRRFTVACLLRILAARPQEFGPGEARQRVFKLLREALPREVFGYCDVNPSAQTYELERALAGFAPKVELSVKRELSSSKSLNQLPAVREGYFRQLFNASHAFLLMPFLPEELSTRTRLKQVFGVVEQFASAGAESKIAARQQCMAELGRFHAEAARFDTDYCRGVLVALAERLRSMVEEDFSSDPLSQPAELLVEAPIKKYSLHTRGARFDVRLAIRNTGKGSAQDVSLRVSAADQALELLEHSFFVGAVAPSDRVGDLKVPVVVQESRQTSWLETEVSWTDPDGSPHEAKRRLTVASQSGDVDWKALRHSEPYDLGPVSSASLLAGRREILDRLVARIDTESLGSVVIHGQRRVGKTSIAKVLVEVLASREKRPLQCIFLEAGEYIREDAAQTIHHLGVRLCEEIQSHNPQLGGLQRPDFGAALAPFADYLRACRQRDPKLRVLVVLDEVDILPVELFKRGPVGDALFATIRSLSGSGACGFVLVGGENMELLLSNQGQALNKFSYERVDYFSREVDWADYVDLVRKPTVDWLEFTDGAIASLFDATAGNPFFTKLVCAELFRSMIRQHDCHATDREAEEAVAATTKAIGANKFQHFWEDGIFERGERQEAVSLRRRAVLIALADALRHNNATIEGIVSRAIHADLSDSNVREEIKEFMRRRILDERDGRVRCTVPLFGRWLQERGVTDIVTTITDRDAFFEQKQRDERDRVQSGELVALVERWSPYQGRLVGEERVRAWLEQFGELAEQRLMFTLLQHIRYEDEVTMRAAFAAVHQMIERDLVGRDIARRTIGRQQKRSDIAVCFVAGQGKSGSQYARVYADLNRIYVDQVVGIAELPNFLGVHSETRGVILVDDFIGSGNTAIECLRGQGQMAVKALSERSIPTYLGIVCGYRSGIERVEAFAAEGGLDLRVMAGDVLTDGMKCFAAGAGVFSSDSERAAAERIARSYGERLVAKNPLGYGDGQSLVVFNRQCPNNVLPILWKEVKGKWVALFPRQL
jgi:hypothetical protein